MTAASVLSAYTNYAYVPGCTEGQFHNITATGNERMEATYRGLTVQDNSKPKVRPYFA